MLKLNSYKYKLLIFFLRLRGYKCIAVNTEILIGEELMHRKLNMLFEPFNIYFEITKSLHPTLENVTVTKYTATQYELGIDFLGKDPDLLEPVELSSSFYNWLYACEQDELFFMPILILLKNNRISYFGELKCE